MNKSLIIIIIFLSVFGLSLLGFYLFSQNQIKPEQPIPEQTQTEEKVVDKFVWFIEPAVIVPPFVASVVRVDVALERSEAEATVIEAPETG